MSKVDRASLRYSQAASSTSWCPGSVSRPGPRPGSSGAPGRGRASWRPGGGAPSELVSRRHRRLAAVRKVRYAQKKPGYHGGASLAELTIPIVVLRPHGTALPSGWIEAPPQEPTWWNEPARLTVDNPSAPAKVTKK